MIFQEHITEDTAYCTLNSAFLLRNVLNSREQGQLLKPARLTGWKVSSTASTY